MNNILSYILILFTGFIICCVLFYILYKDKINRRILRIAKIIIIKTLNYFNLKFQDPIDSCKNCESTINKNKFLKLLPNLDNVKSIEIAPWFTPVLIGEQVKYFDVLDKAGLINKAVENNVSIDKIQEMHYVNANGDMSKIKEKFDLVFSSHNIEHQVDLIKHLQQVGNLLEQNGRFFVIVPDKRYCFDHFISESKLSDVLSVFWQQDKTHSLQTLLSMCETTHGDVLAHWSNKHGTMQYNSNKDCYITTLKQYKDANGSYIDAHKWRFTPQSFYNIIQYLYENKLSPLKIEKIFDTAIYTTEFCCILVKS